MNLDVALGAGIALAGTIITVLTQGAMSRRREKHDLRAVRAAAYGDYLAAQHTVAILLKEVRPETGYSTNDALQRHYASRLTENVEEWRASGRAEMRARLIASGRVQDALTGFEQYIDSALMAALDPKAARKPVTEWDREWNQHLHELIVAMRHDTPKLTRVHIRRQGGSA